MSERARAMHALAGRYFPYVGDEAEYRTTATNLSGAVMVTRLSASGNTITVRFLGEGRRLFGAQRVLQRYSDEGAGRYGYPVPGQPDILAAYVQFWPQPR